MKTLDDLIIQRQKLIELVKYAKLLGGKVHIGNEDISLAELKEMLDNVKIEIGSRRSKQVLRRVK